MKFLKQNLLSILDGDESLGKVIENEHVGRSRWTIQYELIFEKDGKFYSTVYSVGATESQDESPWEYDGDEIECTEVCKVTKTIEVWEPVE